MYSSYITCFFNCLACLTSVLYKNNLYIYDYIWFNIYYLCMLLQACVELYPDTLIKCRQGVESFREGLGFGLSFVSLHIWNESTSHSSNPIHSFSKMHFWEQFAILRPTSILNSLKTGPLFVIVHRTFVKELGLAKKDKCKNTKTEDQQYKF